ncbi:MAG: 23S rRNA pseudouridine(1911/1915/1917) synthase RluD [Nitrosomonas sp.]|jgi:23S rRNA pseudouridine1911/1915/1917 synthase|uniref:23S rRNA pseudouridine(1911/1915/1917) synthase RluD n=1 Tax=Nitrosomonas sp. TaxID=42353 RepID=UPI00272284E8|nr:23S rRNA pseudouridine(1911/1915/1917) synthase RluD [Nitrosomonas sp.]MDO8895884.1 23S rRNA pseudouridine(1911/1915/1917) synthase RluD [Nitrosomonas sp.]MDP1549501.1 23S rRNA pseudouridine(1911/1915/1917) synthase RluD [Nitrosomonas sp.]MDP1935069.1 23S rRNA pseudouridine(1911/1915/1917) synthase RluD [Nitrosomonas sp.]
MTNSVKNKDTSSDYSVKPLPLVRNEPAYSIIDLTIPADYAGLRLDQALAKLLPNWSRSRLQTWITENRVMLDGQVTTIKQKVWGNEHVQVSPQNMLAESTHVAEDIDLNIIHEDEAIIVINKPAGLVTHPGNGNWQGTLLNALLHHAPQLESVPRAGIVHRLDKNTSGLLVVAKTLEAQTNLVRQLQQHTVKRDYLALVLGEVTQTGSVDAPIGRHPIHRTKMAVTTNGKSARTHYQVIENFTGCTLLQCSLETGRTHQIRVHLSSIGHSLAGDPVYGGKLGKTGQIIGQLLISFPRQALHAQKLALTHPQTEQILEWEADAPEDLNNLLQRLRQHSSSKIAG